ncbi:MAG TPA: DUF3267 domain-containing protein [Clostridiaceae bacterium]
MDFKINLKTHIMCFFLSSIFALIFYNLIVDSFEGLLKESSLDPFLNIMYFYVGIIILLIPVTIIHELIHGLFHKLFKGKVKFGFKFIYAYTIEVTARPLSIRKFQIVLLAPLVIISILSYVMQSYLGGIVFILNLLGSSGDVYMALVLVKYNNSYSIVDKSYGFSIINGEQ